MSEVRFPPEVAKLLGEVAWIENKLVEASALGADAAALKAAGDGLGELRKLAARALVADAIKEVKAAKAHAEKMIEGVEAPKKVEAGEDQRRIGAVEDEIERVRDKLRIARKHGASDADIGRIEDDIKALDQPMQRAALAAARAELKEARKELERIEQGRPPPKKDEPKGGPGSSGGSGGGSGGSSGDAPERRGVGQVEETKGKKEALTLYVRSDRTVWAWDRASGTWVPQSFDSDIWDVSLISGGLLVIAEHGAALWDTYLGLWLGQLSVEPEALAEGEAS